MKRITGFPAKTLAKKKDELENWNLICFHKRGKRGKKVYRVKEKGLRHLTEQNIRIRYGLIGLKWAEEAWEKGYRVRFLSDFTQMENHDGFLIAWNPNKGDVRLAEIFGVKEFCAVPGGPTYVGQFVDRKINPNGPIRSNSLQNYVVENVENLENNEEVGKAVKSFFEEHNSFIAVLLPKGKLRFGFPQRKREDLQEIGRFGSLMFVGFKGEGDMPFINRMNIVAGGFNLSENLKLLLNYDVNLIALYSYAWLMVKQQIDSDSVDREQLETWQKKTWLAGFNPKITIACKNADRGGYCKKLKRKCVAVEIREGESHLNFRACQILQNDVEQVHLESA